MATVVVMPSVLAGAGQAAIARWLVAPGDLIEPGTPVAEIETDKALVEYQAEDSGTVGRLVLPEGGAGQPGDPILVLLGDGEASADIDAALGQLAPAPPAPGPAGTPPPAPAPASPPRSRTFASPLVRKLAAGKGIDLAAIDGTGPGSRITRRDLERHLTAPPPPPAPPPAAAAPRQPAPAALPAGARLIPHTPMRRAIARRLTEAKATIPHFSMVTECVVDDLLALRARVNETAPVRASVGDFVLMAAAAAFADVPEANVTWAEEGLIAHANVDISIAVATEGGLVTPVLRDAGRKKLTEVARESADLARRARDRSLRRHELEGGALTISNLGMHGTLEFTAIINPPQSAILAVGAARQQPVARDGTLAVATVMRCTLSADHRAIDGALAARWLAAFTARMQSPLGAIT
jgi:pyruvate dehydrogenase E2 component (dihydrolipoamide acetyltransferase)